ncbi:gp27 [Streptococcus pneumoniae]|nr:gp27 [Streptococcus pneumoniae]
MSLTLTIRDYGVFVVTKDVYDKVKVGDEVLL